MGRRCTPCRQRRGKATSALKVLSTPWMHPVQAAPRQRAWRCFAAGYLPDAPRAGSAEAKIVDNDQKAEWAGCTPCRQRRGKEGGLQLDYIRTLMHPVQAAPRQRKCRCYPQPLHQRCTPCRQRRGKGPWPRCSPWPRRMHPVQAAPRQSRPCRKAQAQAQRCTPCRQRRGKEL